MVAFSLFWGDTHKLTQSVNVRIMMSCSLTFQVPQFFFFFLMLGLCQSLVGNGIESRLILVALQEPQVLSEREKLHACVFKSKLEILSLRDKGTESKASHAKQLANW